MARYFSFTNVANKKSIITPLQRNIQWDYDKIKVLFFWSLLVENMSFSSLKTKLILDFIDTLKRRKNKKIAIFQFTEKVILREAASLRKSF